MQQFQHGKKIDITFFYLIKKKNLALLIKYNQTSIENTWWNNLKCCHSLSEMVRYCIESLSFSPYAYKSIQSSAPTNSDKNNLKFLSQEKELNSNLDSCTYKEVC